MRIPFDYHFGPTLEIYRGVACLKTMYERMWLMFVYFDSLRPINNPSVKKGRVFLG